MDDVQHMTKDKRYYEKHKAEINRKNAARNRLNRLKQKQKDGNPAENVIESGQNAMGMQATILRSDTAVQTDSYDTGLDIYFPLSITDAPTLERILDGNTISQVPQIQDLPPNFAELPAYTQHENFIHIRALVQEWSSKWGGLDNWNHSLDILFKRALQENYYVASHNMVRRIYRHSAKGKSILAKLDEIQGKLPLEPLAVHLLWQYHNELVKILVKGTTVLDSRLHTIHQDLLNSESGGVDHTLKDLFASARVRQNVGGEEDIN